MSNFPHLSPVSSELIIREMGMYPFTQVKWLTRNTKVRS